MRIFKNPPAICFFLPLLFACLTNISAGQEVFYSKPEKNSIIYGYNIIGKVKDHIIVWRYNMTNWANSEILIYDLNMHTIKTVESDILKSNRLNQIDFINNIDSFKVIYQCVIKQQVLFKSATFDENGNCFKTEELESYKDNKLIDRNFRSAYKVFKSDNNKGYALVKATGNDSLNIINVNYIYFLNGLKYTGNEVLPFDFKTSDISDVILNNENLIFSTINKTDSAYWLNLFKINLQTNSLTNTLRQISNGGLVDKSIIITPSLNNYIISAEWKNREKQTSGIFVWKLNDDLSDAVTDTVLEKSANENSVTSNVKNFAINVFQNNSNGVNLFVFSRDNLQTPLSGNFFSKKNNTTYSNNLSYYSKAIGAEGTVSSYNSYTGVTYIRSMYNDGLDDFISYSAQSENSRHYNTSDYDSSIKYNTPVSEKPQDLKLSMLQIDAKSKILNTQTFDGLIDKHAISYVNEAKVLNSRNTFYIVFNQTTKNKKQTLGYIKIHQEDSAYTYNQLVSMQLNYQVMLSKSVQINDNALVVPSTSNNKISFIKIEFQ